MQDLIDLYIDYFKGPANDAGDVPVVEHYEYTPNPYGLEECTTDTGVQNEAGMSPKKLAFELGFLNDIPLLFQNDRRVDGLNEWANPEAFEQSNASNASMLTPLELHWHQLAGVHAIIRTCFTKDPSPTHCTGVLIADEVGLGKTYQAATVIAFLADAALRQKAAIQTMPPILSKPYCMQASAGFSDIFIFLGERPYLQGEQRIPHLPHIIVVPGTLLSQWIDEIRTVFTPKGIDMFTYPMPKEEREFFWKADGHFAATRHSLSSVIIFVT